MHFLLWIHRRGVKCGSEGGEGRGEEQGRVTIEGGKRK
jgi:hypothetical protein